MKVLLFKTSVKHGHEVERVKDLLNGLLQGDRWTIDLDDCDHVLRIVSDKVEHTDITGLLHNEGFYCEAWTE
jgi:hypothetical protein